MVGLHLGIPVVQLLSSPLRFVGVPLVLAGVAIMLWAAGLFRRAGTTIKPFETSSRLVLEGPYRYTRNPMYSGMAGILLGTALLLGSLTPLLVIPVFVAVIQRRFIRAEEAMLETAFADAYRRYKTRVRRWV